MVPEAAGDLGLSPSGGAAGRTESLRHSTAAAAAAAAALPLPPADLRFLPQTGGRSVRRLTFTLGPASGRTGLSARRLLVSAAPYPSICRFSVSVFLRSLSIRGAPARRRPLSSGM